MPLPSSVRLVDIGPRGGLQNEATPVPTVVTVTLIDHLGEAGLQTIEPGSFVSPKWVPQMVATGDVLAGGHHLLSLFAPPSLRRADTARVYAVFVDATRMARAGIAVRRPC